MERPEGWSRRRLLVVVGVLAVALTILAVGYTVVFACGPFGEMCPEAAESAQFTLATNHSGESVTATITHDGGKRFEAGDLVLAAGDRERTWATLANVSATTRVGPGDSVTVIVDPGTELRLVWVSDDGEHRATVWIGDVENASSADSRRRPAPPRR